MGLDLEKLMILLQRRYNAIREIKRLTEELQDAGAREDAVSANLILQMRTDELGKIEKVEEQFHQMAKAGQKEREEIRRLMSREFLSEEKGESPAENKILELRKKTAVLIAEVQRADKAFNMRAAGSKSFYRKNR